jgi:hypothetical protein
MHFEDVQVGDPLPVVKHRPSRVQLFRFSAATWNAHRIHYDEQYSKSEGYPGVLVQSHLHGSLLARAALAWTGGTGVLRRFRWENRAFAVADDLLFCTGVVSRTYREGGSGLVDLELEERTEQGVLCAPAWATVQLPIRHVTCGPEQ